MTTEEKIKLTIGSTVEIEGQEFILVGYKKSVDMRGMSVEALMQSPLFKIASEEERRTHMQALENAKKVGIRVLQQMEEGEEWKNK